MDPKTITLRYADGTEREHTIAPMPVARWETAEKFAPPVAKHLNEFRLLDLAFNQAEGWSKTLTPESYTAATEAMYAVDLDFFALCARRQAWQAAMTGATS